ncbi:hypothetical protein Rleg_0068 [Rhizobium leguminosarum bv. trifolii WSM1325]|uniref:Uncharacterized protein n=1 Tax=Rhizobium leguminosarum bv. trifolii (strain WSM1325) TaxID=395491 RepID=C6AZ53_RHILS|nr:hypothetical protein Rleg_0068 [Rhizobium leguminosarum bv. trifolii WSM1325]
MPEPETLKRVASAFSVCASSLSATLAAVASSTIAAFCCAPWPICIMAWLIFFKPTTMKSLSGTC